MDVILGDIRSFLTDEVLEKNDVFGHAGHMQIFRNNDDINSIIFNTPKDIFNKIIFDTNNNYFFDERDYSRFNLFRSEKKLLLCDYYADVRPPSRQFGIRFFKFTFRGQIEDNGFKTCFYYDRNKGKLYYIIYKKRFLQKKELLYVHLQKRKMKNLVYNSECNFVCFPNRFVECDDEKMIFHKCRFNLIDFIRCMYDNRKVYFVRFKNKIFKR